MKCTVTINEKSKSITVDLDGYKGTAKCCPTDSFNITTGIELALERAKVAKRNAEIKKAEGNTPNLEGYGNIMALVKALEKALPKGQVVLVGNGDGLTKSHKEWLRSLAGCDGKCYAAEDIEEIEDSAYHDGYDDGYNDGYADATDELDGEALSESEIEELANTVHNLIVEALG